MSSSSAAVAKENLEIARLKQRLISAGMAGILEQAAREIKEGDLSFNDRRWVIAHAAELAEKVSAITQTGEPADTN